MKKLSGSELAAAELGKLKAVLMTQAESKTAAPQRMEAMPLPAAEQEKPPVLTKGQREAIAIIEAALLDMNQTLLGISELARKAKLYVPQLYIEASRSGIGEIWHQLDELQQRADSTPERLQ